MIGTIKKIFRKFGIGLVRYRDLEVLRKNSIELGNLKNLVQLQEYLNTSSVPKSVIKKVLIEFPNSMSQIQQDLFALIVSDFKLGGFFVDFGATNGISLSNSFLLEKNFGWKGILAEPAKAWHSSLLGNRDAIIEKRCVWSTTGDFILFNETDIGELSTVDFLSSNDTHFEFRKKGQKYEVETITLEDMLTQYGSPKYIDFLSIDTEGSEFEILNSFNFEKFTFGFICCEHNFTPNRELLFNLLSSKGYIRVFSEYSRWDDWYIHSSVDNKLFK